MALVSGREILRAAPPASTMKRCSAVEAGIRKVNLSTALQKVFMETLRRSAAAPGHQSDARAVLGDARHRTRLLGATGRG